MKTKSIIITLPGGGLVNLTVRNNKTNVTQCSFTTTIFVFLTSTTTTAIILCPPCTLSVPFPYPTCTLPVLLLYPSCTPPVLQYPFCTPEILYYPKIYFGGFRQIQFHISTSTIFFLILFSKKV